MKVNLSWMTNHLGISRCAFYRNIKKGLIPPPNKNNARHAEWDGEEIKRLFPDGWRKIPESGGDVKWMCVHFRVRRTRFHELVSLGRIPKPIRLSGNKVYWVKDEILKDFPEGKA